MQQPTDPHLAASRLSSLALSRLEAAHLEAAALEALSALAALLDPAGRLTTWQLARLVAEHVCRFETMAWPRIRRGGRTPRNPAEHLMSAYLGADLPRSARRIWDLLA